MQSLKMVSAGPCVSAGGAELLCSTAEAKGRIVSVLGGLLFFFVVGVFVFFFPLGIAFSATSFCSTDFLV